MNVLFTIAALIIGYCLGVFMICLLGANNNNKDDLEEQIKFLEECRRNKKK